MLLAQPALVQAHHAFAAEFDADKPIDLNGTVTKVKWVNPHSWLYFDVKGADGAVTNWGVEFGTPNALARKGLAKTGSSHRHAGAREGLSLEERRRVRLLGDAHAARWTQLPDRRRAGHSGRELSTC